jgi:hypothetical protein
VNDVVTELEQPLDRVLSEDVGQLLRVRRGGIQMLDPFDERWLSLRPATSFVTPCGSPLTQQIARHRALSTWLAATTRAPMYA